MPTLFQRKAQEMGAMGSGRNPLLNGLIAYWKFEESSDGNAALVGRVDTVSGMVLTDVGKLASGVGKFGAGLSYPASGTRYLKCSSNPTIQSGDNPFTWATWVYFTSKAVNQGIWSHWNSTGANREIDVTYQTASDRFTLEYCSAGAGTNYATLAADNFGALTLNKWHLVTVWHDPVANQVGIQVNGTTPNTASYSYGIASANADFNVGVLTGGIPLKSGRIDSLAKWNRVLTAADRATLWNGGLGATPYGETPNLNIVFEGDSITEGATPCYRNSNSYPNQMITSLPGAIRSWSDVATGGQTVVQMLTQVATDMTTAYNATANNIAVFQGGTNDIRLSADTAATIATNIQTECTNIKALGYKVILLNMLPSTNAGNPGDFATRQGGVNAILAADHSCADYYIDIAALLPNPDDTSLYNSDKLHPGGAGNTLIAAAVKTAVLAL